MHEGVRFGASRAATCEEQKISGDFRFSHSLIRPADPSAHRSCKRKSRAHVKHGSLPLRANGGLDFAAPAQILPTALPIGIENNRQGLGFCMGKRGEDSFALELDRNIFRQMGQLAPSNVPKSLVSPGFLFLRNSFRVLRSFGVRSPDCPQSSS